MKELHPQLKTYFKELRLKTNHLPDMEQWKSFVQRLDESYRVADEEREPLKKEGQMLNAVINSSLNPIITFRSDGIMLHFNPAAERLFRRPKSLVLGKHWTEMYQHTIFDQASYDRMEKLISTGQHPALNKPMKYALKQAGRPAEDIEVTVTSIDAAKFKLYVFFVRIVTEENQLKQTVETLQNQAELASKLAALGEMAGSVAHEINTPLNIFSMYGELLRDAALSEKIDRHLVQEAAEAIEETALRTSKIIDGLKSALRDDGKEPFQDVSVKSIISDTLTLCENRLKSRAIQLKVADVEPWWSLECRAVQISQVLINLLNNASDAIENLAEKWIRLDCRLDGKIIEFRVTDSGSGISEQIRQKIMQPFFTTKQFGEGTGLGLSISKNIIESHNGTLTCDESCPHTSFVVRLPVAGSRIAAQSA